VKEDVLARSMLAALAIASASSISCDPAASTSPDAADGKRGARKPKGPSLAPQTAEHVEACLELRPDSEEGAESVSKAPMLACQAIVPMADDVHEHLQARCDGGEGAACHALGDALRGERLVKYLAALVRTACGPKQSCDMLARRYAVSRFGPAQADAADRAAKLIAKGCELGSGEACLTRASLAEDPSEVADWMARACKLGIAAGCAHEVHYVLFFGGSNVDSTAVESLRKLCKEGQASACASLGVLIAGGHGGLEASKLEALGLYDRACQGGSPGGCASVVFHAMQNAVDDGTRDEAGQKLVAICAGDDVGPECTAAAVALQRGWGTKADRAAAKAMLADNCDLGIEAACWAAKKKK
jgi:hypothetical protein